jgi:hypothetical protein
MMSIVWVNDRTGEKPPKWDDVTEWEGDGDTIYVDRDGCLSVGGNLRTSASAAPANAPAEVKVDQKLSELPPDVEVVPKDPSGVSSIDVVIRYEEPAPVMVWPVFYIPQTVHDTFAKYQTLLCDVCITMRNLVFDLGTLIKVFCPGCRRAIAEQPENKCPMGAPRCQKYRWVTELGDVEPICRGCCPGQVTPLLPSFVPGPTRTAFEANARILCSYCMTMQNFEFGDKGELVRAFCLSCQIRIAHQPANKCDAGTPRCQKYRWVDPMGDVSPMCRGCCPGQVTPLLPSFVPGPTRTAFEANAGILCSHCITMQNFEFADKGELVRVFCLSCQIRIAHQPANKCDAGTPKCQKYRWVDPMGGVSPMCRGCHRYIMHGSATQAARMSRGAKN